MNNLILTEPVVTSTFLFKIFQAPNLIILDASMASVGQKDFKIPTKGIQGARYIHWKKDFVDTSSSIPNMLPSEDYFAEAAKNMGINNNSAIVVYDQKGIYSSPRIWWMFKTMGHDNIAILDGGLPGWKKENLPEGHLDFDPIEKGNFNANFNPNFVSKQTEVLSNIENKNSCILDARSNGRFHGTSPEPRPELRSGHIPNSKSLPYSTLIKDGFFLPKEEIKEILESLIPDNKSKIVFSCGSGITASILFIAANYAGFESLSLYDGSWSEWGIPSDFPIEI